jgi:hypothetical protein
MLVPRAPHHSKPPVPRSLARVLALRAGNPLTSHARALAGHETDRVPARELQHPLVAVARRARDLQDFLSRHLSPRESLQAIQQLAQMI